MLRRIGAILRGLTAALALIATLGVSVLPNGQLPKVAGPCGRALCNCAAVDCGIIDTDTLHCKNHRKFSSIRVVTLGASIFSGVEAPGIAFQAMFDVAVAPNRYSLLSTATEQTEPRIVSSGFALLASSFELITPPPRSL